MIIDLYADVVCPWCYIGTRRLARALELRPELEIERHWRPFQLRPEMPAHGQPWVEFVREKFGGMEQATPIFARVAGVGAADGIHFAFDRITSAANTRDAHRLILFAATHGLEWRVAEACFAANFAEGRDLNSHDELVDIAVRAGLDPVAAREALVGDAYGAEVDASQGMAASLGITGVPFYVLDGRYGISGAQPVEVLLQALDAYAEQLVAG
jgi:predicted DsbA family dithiol-disulfide isomerase